MFVPSKTRDASYLDAFVSRGVGDDRTKVSVRQQHQHPIALALEQPHHRIHLSKRHVVHCSAAILFVDDKILVWWHAHTRAGARRQSQTSNSSDRGFVPHLTHRFCAAVVRRPNATLHNNVRYKASDKLVTAVRDRNHLLCFADTMRLATKSGNVRLTTRNTVGAGRRASGSTGLSKRRTNCPVGKMLLLHST